MVIGKAISVVLAIVFGLVGVVMLVTAGPSLVGDMIVEVEGSYIENATGCYIDQPTGTPDTEVESFYCTGFGLMPLVIVALFFALVIGFIVSIFLGWVKIPKLGL